MKLFLVWLFLASLLWQEFDACASQTISRQAVVTVKNYGAYIARFRISYRYQGQFKVEESDSFLAGQSQALTIPQYSTNAELYIENMIFIFVWRKIYSSQILPWSRLCIIIEGTTLDPFMKYC